MMNKRQRKKERKKRAAAAWFSMMDGMDQFLGYAYGLSKAKMKAKEATKAFDNFAARVYLALPERTDNEIQTRSD